MKRDLQYISHESLKPFIYPEAEILILGSLPSVKSREENFYYAHKSNRFYKVLAGIYEEATPITIEEKKAFLKRHHIALYDSIYSCYIHGSSDASIKDITPSDVKSLIKNTNVKKIFTTGKLAYKVYQEHIENDVGIKAISLPNTSSANASISLDELIELYKVMKE